MKPLVERLIEELKRITRCSRGEWSKVEVTPPVVSDCGANGSSILQVARLGILNDGAYEWGAGHRINGYVLVPGEPFMAELRTSLGLPDHWNENARIIHLPGLWSTSIIVGMERELMQSAEWWEHVARAVGTVFSRRLYELCMSAEVIDDGSHWALDDD